MKITGVFIFLLLAGCSKEPDKTLSKESGEIAELTFEASVALDLDAASNSLYTTSNITHSITDALYDYNSEVKNTVWTDDELHRIAFVRLQGRIRQISIDLPKK